MILLETYKNIGYNTYALKKIVENGDFMAKIQGFLRVKNNGAEEVIQVRGVKLENRWIVYDSDSAKYSFDYSEADLKYSKVSSEALDIVFDLKKTTKANYWILQQQMQFSVKTDVLRVEDQNIFVSYHLYQDGARLNTIEFSLICDALKEDLND